MHTLANYIRQTGAVVTTMRNGFTEALLDTLLASPGAATAKLDGESAVLLSQSTTSLSSAERALSGARAALEDARTGLDELKTQGVLAGPAKTAREAAVAAVGSGAVDAAATAALFGGAQVALGGLQLA